MLRIVKELVSRIDQIEVEDKAFISSYLAFVKVTDCKDLEDKDSWINPKSYIHIPFEILL